MRISDWSSDVCSSDLCQHRAENFFAHQRIILAGTVEDGGFDVVAAAIVPHAAAAQSQRGAFALAGMDAVEHGLQDRKSVVSGTSLSVRVDLGGRGIIKKKIILQRTKQTDKKLK